MCAAGHFSTSSNTSNWGLDSKNVQTMQRILFSLFLLRSPSLSLYFSTSSALSAASVSQFLATKLLKILTKWLSWLPIVGFPYWNCLSLSLSGLSRTPTQPQNRWNNSLTFASHTSPPTQKQCWLCEALKCKITKYPNGNCEKFIVIYCQSWEMK